MAGDHFDDEDDVYGHTSPPAKPRKATNSALLVAMMLGGALLVGLLLCGGLMFLFRGAMPPEPPVKVADAVAVRPDNAPDGQMQPTRKRSATLSRKEFESKVQGKTRDEVMAAVGGPDAMQMSVPGGDEPGGGDAGGLVPAVHWWVYRDRVVNEATGKPYPTVRVRFNDSGKVDRIEYP
jgi:hypothetical protein